MQSTIIAVQMELAAAVMATVRQPTLCVVPTGPTQIPGANVAKGADPVMLDMIVFSLMEFKSVSPGGNLWRSHVPAQ